ncbi:hypothetical protein ALC53_02897 [Atta colombica]|uniref:Uncharacterized protein n=1 Tax=Atta colombica TaxID=520822 RepID=A0A195BR27_9HYME|nr:hypothetical protein ALC53_02897 [Atta colombica]
MVDTAVAPPTLSTTMMRVGRELHCRATSVVATPATRRVATTTTTSYIHTSLHFDNHFTLSRRVASPPRVTPPPTPPFE